MKPFAFASYALYFLAGLVMTTVGSVMPQLLKHYELSYTDGGQLVFLSSVGFLLGVPFSALIMSRLSVQNALALACLTVTVSQLGIAALPPFGVVLLLNFINSFGAATVEVTVAALMMEVFVGRRAVVMSYLEVSFGLGALLMPIIASILIGNGVWSYSFIITGTLALLLAVVWKKIVYSQEGADVTEAADAAEAAPPQHLSRVGKGLLLSLFLLMIFMYSGIEGSLNNFLSSIFIDYVGTAQNYAALSIGVFWAAMVLGRLATGWIIRKVNYSRFLLASMLGSLVIWTVFIVSHSAIASFLLIPALGLTLSGIYSITMVYANHTFPGKARVVTSLVTGFAGIGGAVFPALVGYTMDRAAPAAALWLVAAYIAAYLLLLSTVIMSYRKRASVALEQGIDSKIWK
ncbi:MFS transporter [Paenibacillus sp. MSJ-34]|uniref:MFS transporter n=1 Tax=Paenibacillus sp. MSJ-34 TaxID=2841529 RepID=UPI001C1062A7|nr:MFS transporter [Paenibacillus sp. MSJ-34]